MREFKKRKAPQFLQNNVAIKIETKITIPKKIVRQL